MQVNSWLQGLQHQRGVESERHVLARLAHRQSRIGRRPYKPGSRGPSLIPSLPLQRKASVCLLQPRFSRSRPGQGLWREQSAGPRSRLASSNRNEKAPQPLNLQNGLCMLVNPQPKKGLHARFASHAAKLIPPLLMAPHVVLGHARIDALQSLHMQEGTLLPNSGA